MDTQLFNQLKNLFSNIVDAKLSVNTVNELYDMETDLMEKMSWDIELDSLIIYKPTYEKD